MSADSVREMYVSEKGDEKGSGESTENVSDEFLKNEEARQQTWRTIQEQIKERLGLQRFGLWFKQTELMKLDDDEMVVGVPNVIVKQYLEQKYQSTVEATAEELMGEGLEVRFDVAPKLLRKMRKERKEGEAGDDTNESASGSEERARKRPKEGAKKKKDITQEQSPEYTFEKLVLTDANRLPFLAAREIASRDDAQFKFLLVMGEHGVGKTALLRAAYNKARESQICGKVHYCRGENWCNEYYHALQRREMRKFRRQHRKWDILIVDGIHFLEGKPAAQEELLHTVKTIQESGGRLVLSTYGHPHDLQEAKPSFQNLIGGAFWVELKTPPERERVEVACQLARRRKLDAKSEVFEFLAQEYGSNLRELEAAIRSLAAAGSLQGLDKMGLSMARRLLGRVRGNNRGKTLTLKDICEAVVDNFDVSREQLKGRSRRRTVCRARQAAMYLARRKTDLSLSDVGRWFGGRTHSTVKHSVEQAESHLDKSGEFARKMEATREALGGC